MQPFPHHYSARASARPTDVVLLSGTGLPVLASAPPVEFGGSGGLWSPENLLVAAVADCYVLTFRALARRSGLPWRTLRCDVTGTLERLDRAPQFSEFSLTVSLEVEEGADEAEARSLLARTEAGCLVTNSLKGRTRLTAQIIGVPAVRIAS